MKNLILYILLTVSTLFAEFGLDFNVGDPISKAAASFPTLKVNDSGNYYAITKIEYGGSTFDYISIYPKNGIIIRISILPNKNSNNAISFANTLGTLLKQYGNYDFNTAASLTAWTLKNKRIFISNVKESWGLSANMINMDE